MHAQNPAHDAAKLALEREGWTITHDPLRFDFCDQDLQVSYGAETPTRKIAVAVQPFSDSSLIGDLEQAVGAFGVGRMALAEVEPVRQMVLAVPEWIGKTFFTGPFAELLVAKIGVRAVVFDEREARVIRWVEPNGDQNPGIE